MLYDMQATKCLISHQFLLLVADLTRKAVPHLLVADLHSIAILAVAVLFKNLLLTDAEFDAVFGSFEHIYCD